MTYNLGPGQYNVKPCIDEALIKRAGHFGKALQYPLNPTDRIIASTLALKPRNAACFCFSFLYTVRFEELLERGGVVFKIYIHSA